MNFNKLNTMIKINTYESLVDNESFDVTIYKLFDYILRIDVEEYPLFLNFIYNKFNYKVFNTIIVGILKNFNSICNYTLDDLDGNYDFQEKKYILNKYKELKEKDKMINDFYVSKLRKDTIKKRVRRA